LIRDFCTVVLELTIVVRLFIVQILKAKGHNGNKGNWQFCWQWYKKRRMFNPILYHERGNVDAESSGEESEAAKLTPIPFILSICLCFGGKDPLGSESPFAVTDVSPST
jgi:hypothetical protein